MRIGLTPYQPAIAALTPQEDDFMEDRIAKLETTSANHTAALAKLETEMDDRIQHMQEQITDLQHNKVGVELRGDINRRFDEMRQDIDRRFDDLKQEIDRRFNDLKQEIDRRFDDLKEHFTQRFDQTDKRLDRIEATVDGVRRDLHVFMLWMVGGQLTIAFGVLALAAKAFYGQ
ncbi:DUF4407 domain-containing protein [Duganella sp. FT80W]|uniref:DUF4407 domain-containing protein n=1 Tax=Duganella guangzhouensis TaxID=2666084 RepID=A0A6I2KST1_9BURK|nr:DUF4407 domain-containing protein [Duganella guangzhouensis]MRW88798.1 DUF4407 domain-containing protein [Duganella guangzhouensis]